MDGKDRGDEGERGRKGEEGKVKGNGEGKGKGEIFRPLNFFLRASAPASISL